MEFICHRRNTIEELKSTDINCGVEIDIRSFSDMAWWNTDSSFPRK